MLCPAVIRRARAAFMVDRPSWDRFIIFSSIGWPWRAGYLLLSTHFRKNLGLSARRLEVSHDSDQFFCVFGICGVARLLHFDRRLLGIAGLEHLLVARSEEHTSELQSRENL